MTTELEKKNFWLTFITLPTAAFLAAEITYGVLQKTESIVKKKITKDIDAAIQSECHGLGAKNKDKLIEDALERYEVKSLGNSLASRFRNKDLQWKVDQKIQWGQISKDIPILLTTGLTAFIWYVEDPFDFIGEKGFIGTVVGLKALFGERLFSYGPPGRGNLNGYLSWWNRPYTEALNETLQPGKRLQSRIVTKEEIPESLGKDGAYRTAVQKKQMVQVKEPLRARRTFIVRQVDLEETVKVEKQGENGTIQEEWVNRTRELRPGEKRRWLPGNRRLVTTEATIPERGFSYGAIQCLEPPSSTGGGSVVMDEDEVGVTAAAPATSAAGDRLVIVPGEERGHQGSTGLFGPDGKPLTVSKIQNIFETNSNAQPIIPKFPLSFSEATAEPWYDTFIFNPVKSLMISALKYSGTPVNVTVTGQLSSSPSIAPVSNFNSRPVFAN